MSTESQERFTDELDALLNDAVETAFRMKYIESYGEMNLLTNNLRDHYSDFFVNWAPDSDENEGRENDSANP